MTTPVATFPEAFPCQARCYDMAGRSGVTDKDAAFTHLVVQDLHAQCADFCQAAVGTLAATNVVATNLVATTARFTGVTAANLLTSTAATNLNVTAAHTLTATELLSGVIGLQSSGGPFTLTLPTATVLHDGMLAAGLTPAVGDKFYVNITVPTGSPLATDVTWAALPTGITLGTFAGIAALPTLAAASLKGIDLLLSFTYTATTPAFVVRVERFLSVVS